MELKPGIPIHVVADWGSVVGVMDRLRHYALIGIDAERTHPTTPDGYISSSLTVAKYGASDCISLLD